MVKLFTFEFLGVLRALYVGIRSTKCRVPKCSDTWERGAGKPIVSWSKPTLSMVAGT